MSRTGPNNALITRTLIGVLALAFMASHLAAATEYFVSKSGSDQNSGSQGAPWATIGFAASQLGPGDIVHVSAGTYDERIVSGAAGTDSAPIHLVADGEVITQGFVLRHPYFIVEGFKVWTDAPSQHAFDVRASYVQIIGNEVARAGPNSRGITFINGRQAEGCLVKGNKIYGQVSAMAVELHGRNHVVEDNEIGPLLNADAFRAFGSGHVIRRNFIHDLSSTGFHVDIFQTFGNNGWIAHDILFEQNLAVRIDGQVCFISQDGSDVRDLTFRNNVYWDVSLAGQTYAPRTLFINNTFHRVGAGNGQVLMFRWEMGGRRGDVGDASGSAAINNIFSETGGSANNGWYDLLSTSSTLPEVDLDYNLAFPAKQGLSEPNGINGSDPCFVDADAGDFGLAQCSAARGTGQVRLDFSDDHFGNPRPVTGWDIGAIQGSGNGARTPSAPLNLRRAQRR